MAIYVLDLPPALEHQPVECGDGTLLHRLAEALRGQGASEAGLSVRVQAADDGDTAAELTDLALAELDGDTLLIDVEPCELAGTSAVRTLLLVQLGGLVTVVLEQWRLVALDRRWLVTATADLAAWASLAPMLRASAATLRLEPEEAP